MSLEQLQNTIDQRLGLNDIPDRRRFRNTNGRLQPENKKLAEAVLSGFFEMHKGRFLQESKLLSEGGTGTVSDSAVPATFEFAVIREALFNLVGIQFVDYGAAEFSESHFIPYSYRKTSAAGIEDTRTYEGAAIQRAAMAQAGETAYPIPQKISFEVSDELRYLTSNKQLDFEAVRENQNNAARIISEDLDRLIFNEQVQSSDEYQVTRINDEDLSQYGKKVALIGGDEVTTICRPRKVFNIQGEQVGNTHNPVIVMFDGVECTEYSTSDLPTGIYFVLDYDIGEIFLVNQDGELIDPVGKSWSVSYSKVTNVAYFDTDVPDGTKPKEHWDTFLRLYALRKSLIEDSRFYQATFGLMSGNTMVEIEQAEKFGANHRVPGSEINEFGNLGMIKNIPNFKTSAPGLWMADRRVVIGEAGVTRLRIVKPWEMGALDNQTDANGRFTGKKEAYGDQFVILHTPKHLKAALTSIVLYSRSARVARNTI